jgi:hypothetical protein
VKKTRNIYCLDKQSLKEDDITFVEILSEYISFFTSKVLQKPSTMFESPAKEKRVQIRSKKN